MEVEQLIATCAKVTRSKGFDTTQHATQILLVASEVVEAMDHVSLSRNFVVDSVAQDVRQAIARLEKFREKTDRHADKSRVLHEAELIEELADVCIRVFSYIGSNDQQEKFVQILAAKIEKNKHRPVKHGKGF